MGNRAYFSTQGLNKRCLKQLSICQNVDISLVYLILSFYAGYLNVFCETLLDVLDKIPGDSRTQIGFIGYDSAIHFFNLDEGLSQPQMLTVSDTDGKIYTGKLRYLEFQGNAENTSSFPKFEIANYDVHFRLKTLSDRFLNGILA